MNNCCICDEIKTKKFAYSDIYDTENRIVFEDNDFIAFPSVSPLVEGHILVFPKIHINNVMQLTESKIIEIFSLTKYLYSEFLMELGDYFVYEHGVPNDQELACGMNHAHIHLIPIQGAVIGSLYNKIQNEFTVEKYPTIKEMKGGLDSQPNHYLMLYDGKSNYQIASRALFESQMLRRYIAEEMGQLVWDWQKLYGKAEFHASNERFKLA